MKIYYKMITTKAYITELPEEGSNIFKVNIPLMADNVNDEAIFDALLCYNEGNYKGLNVGDCVFVDFEDDKYNMAIILGKLFIENPEKNTAFGLYNQLTVTDSAVLPQDTTIGKYTIQDIFNLYQGVNNGTGGGSGTINPEDLKGYVTGEAFESEDEETHETIEKFANRIMTMSGEEFDEYVESEDWDPDIDGNTIFFLTSARPSEE